MSEKRSASPAKKKRPADKKSAARSPANRRLAAPRSSQQRVRTAPRVPLRARLRLTRYRLTAAWARLRAPLLFSARLLAVAAVVAGAASAGHLIERHARTSKSFATTLIEVKGLSRLSRDDVLGKSGLRPGQNVFEVSAAEAELRLLSHPWILSASVERRLPGTYRLQIRERQAVALLSMGDLYLVCSEAKVFKKLAEGDPVDLPVITGIEREQFTAEREFRTAVLIDAVALLDDYHDLGLARRQPVSEVHLQGDGGFSLYLGADAAHVDLGRPPFRAKLRRLHNVLDRLEEKKAQPAYVYLANDRRPDRVTVRLR